MIIIWGTKTRYDNLGTVADVCPVCRRIRAFTLTDVFSASHVYYIALGGWSFEARIKRCWECGTDFHARLKDYDDLVDEEEAEEMSLRQLVHRTNEPLADWMADLSRNREGRTAEPKRERIDDDLRSPSRYDRRD